MMYRTTASIKGNIGYGDTMYKAIIQRSLMDKRGCVDCMGCDEAYDCRKCVFVSGAILCINCAYCSDISYCVSCVGCSMLSCEHHMLFNESVEASHDQFN